ncbi:MAG TPA: hypothetical protein VFZ61_15815, partial [Polyangiales bacterium]
MTTVGVFPSFLAQLRAGGLGCSCLALTVLASGCGRIGLELSPAGERDADIAELDAGEPTLDASEPTTDAEEPPPDAGEVDAGPPQVDGCVPGDAGGCATCDPASYEGVTCGVGYCRSNSVPSRCDELGVEIACVPGAPRADSDSTCDGVDDDCSGQADEDYVGSATSCGTGACTAGGLLMCSAGTTLDTCVARDPMTTADDPSGSGNGIDDDCDGRIDEDVSPCDTTPRTFEAGSYVNVMVPEGCTTATVQLWGGAGGGGGRAGISAMANGGRGGSGGYARTTLSLSGPLTLYVGTGGRVECLTPGMNAGSPAYSGGAGGIILNPGKNGEDGDISGGGQGATNLLGERGGNGYYGGGGGGSSSADPVNGVGGWGGGGGAASVALLNGALVMVAGGGG